MRALAIALVLLATPAEALTLQQAVDWAHCRLYPSHARCRAPEAVQAPSVVPAPAPVVVQPPPVATPQAPPRGAQKVRRPVKPKWKPAKPAKRLAARIDGGPDLPWPCWKVRLGAAGKTEAQLRAEGRQNGIRLSRKQIRQAQACLASK